MADKMFTNQTGAYGITADGDSGPSLTGSFRVAESSSADTVILKGQVLQIDPTTLRVSTATAATQQLIGIALQDVTVKDTDAQSGVGVTGDPLYKGPKVVEVCIYGLCEARISGTTVAANAHLSPTTGGQVNTVVVTTGNSTVGLAMESTAGTAGEFRTVFVNINKVP